MRKTNLPGKPPGAPQSTPQQNAQTKKTQSYGDEQYQGQAQRGREEQWRQEQRGQQQSQSQQHEIVNTVVSKHKHINNVGGGQGQAEGIDNSQKQRGFNDQKKDEKTKSFGFDDDIDWGGYDDTKGGFGDGGKGYDDPRGGFGDGGKGYDDQGRGIGNSDKGKIPDFGEKRETGDKKGHDKKKESDVEAKHRESKKSPTILETPDVDKVLKLQFIFVLLSDKYNLLKKGLIHNVRDTVIPVIEEKVKLREILDKLQKLKSNMSSSV
jgi:hypothetical protein